MREAQNDCSGFPAHRNNKTSRVGEDWPQIHCAGMSARSPGESINRDEIVCFSITDFRTWASPSQMEYIQVHKHTIY